VKRTLIIIIAGLVIGYIIISAYFFRDSSLKGECVRFEVEIKDSLKTQFITAKEIIALVKKYDLYPVGKSFKDINTLAIRDTIMSNRLVESAKVFRTSKGTVMVTVQQREPVYRVISNNRGSFYVDKDRKIMPVASSFTVYVPVVTGDINEDFAKNELFDFVMFINNNSEWDAWVEQIVVTRDNEVELIPRVGNFRIILGSLEDYPIKLNKFVRFVDDGLNVVGWNRYSVINLKFDKQVVCTLK
jgi:cell division protein FtsQ